MNEPIRKILKVALDDNLRMWDVIGQVYDLGVEDGKQSVPKGLPGVTEQQLAAELMEYEPIGQGSSVVKRLTDWFNDPNRDAPTMHPDLEWLASLPPEKLKTTPHAPGLVHFYRYCSEGSYYEDRVGVAVGRSNIPKNQYGFTLAEIEQVRRHLAKQKASPEQPAMSRESALEALRGFFCYEPQAYRNAIVSDMAADAKVLAKALQVLAEEDQMHRAPPHVGVRKDVGGRVAEDGTPLDLNNLPDYETWFETHGDERTVKYRPQDTREATVHELYTHFRARLLDELRQAGVLGDDS